VARGGCIHAVVLLLARGVRYDENHDIHAMSHVVVRMWCWWRVAGGSEWEGGGRAGVDFWMR